MPNRLAAEKSPYLLQHAHNPVDWLPWGPEAFEKARTEDKPIFLSIGYSTCHWCHVMERESFEDEEIAELLNRYFVPVKVDREERPDVDRIYMTFVQATTGGGGWPMSVWLTPELKPFFGGTYFPPDNRYGRPGFKSVLESLARAWAMERDRINEASADVVSQLEKISRLEARAAVPDPGVLDSAFYGFRRSYDSRSGGFGGAPKFPRPAVHNFLVRYHHRTGNEEALEMTLFTLREMAKGGIHDHIGGGFHRYSVDERWFTPHFEKMLYDQAQLAISALEAYQITRDHLFAEIARDIFTYVLRDMTSPEGAFYSAEDADSVLDPAQPHVKGEGAFYVWSKAELSAALEPAALEWFCYAYGVRDDGNVRDDPHGEFRGRNILYQAHTAEETAARFDAAVEDVRAALENARAALLRARSRRVRPHLDDKIITAWNALMISAFAKGAQILNDASYERAARRAAEFIIGRMFDPQQKALLRRYRDGDASIPGFLDDYAFFIQALLDLYEADFVPERLLLASELANQMRVLFEDQEYGGFFSTRAGDSNLILRMKDDYDGAEPSGNSIAASVLIRLARIMDRAAFHRSAERALAAMGSRMSQTPTAAPQAMVALMEYLAPPRQIVIAGDSSELLGAVRRRFLPFVPVVRIDSDRTREALSRDMPAVGGMRPLNGRPAAYVCENFVCRLPVTEVAELEQLLK
jgi:uncharacterized protein YyaL (SSP411 family)